MTESPTPDTPPDAAITSDGDLASLPNYARNLLKVEVPLVVRLAEKKQKIEDILRLGPGAIIQFEKSCDQPLDLIVGGQPVAEGEAVKVGEMFGFQVSAMTLPEEHFAPLLRSQVAAIDPPADAATNGTDEGATEGVATDEGATEGVATDDAATDEAAAGPSD